MSAGETAYLVLVVAAFGTIMATLADASLSAWLPERKSNG
jgi:hypothetical protein